ncbi:MAG: hypothetical protein IAG13_23075, partial [Deltaproteobacteria bacterium]|nr:hypothetical protein [Nannocystaceae bacterium]
MAALAVTGVPMVLFAIGSVRPTERAALEHAVTPVPPDAVTPLAADAATEVALPSAEYLALLRAREQQADAALA